MGNRCTKQHFTCKNCGILFTGSAPEQRPENGFIWFKEWGSERQTFETLSRDSALSKRTLQRIFYTFPEVSPKVNIIKRSNVHLRMDATSFKQTCFVCDQDDEDGYNQLIRVTDAERYTKIKEGLDHLPFLSTLPICNAVLN